MSTELATPPPATAAPKVAAPAVPSQAPASTAPSATPPKAAQQAPQRVVPSNRSIDQVLSDVAREVVKDETESRPGDQSSDAERATAKTTTPAKPSPKAKTETAPEAKAKADPEVGGESEIDKLIEPEGMAEGNKANFRTLRETAKKEINALKNERAALSAKLKTYETATPADTEKATRLEAQLKEVQDRLAVFDLKSHPDFVRQYDEPRRNALKEAGEIVAYNGKEGVDLKAILDLPQKDFNAKVSELTKDMNGMDATTVQSALRQAHKLTNDERLALSQAGELKKQLESKAASAARQAFERTRDEIKSKVQMLQVPEGASPEKTAEINEYNQAVVAALAEAETNSFGRMSEADVARISHEAAMLKPIAQKLIPALQRDLKASNDLVAQLTEELNAIKSKKNPGTFTSAGSDRKAPQQRNSTTTPDFGSVANQVGMR